MKSTDRSVAILYYISIGVHLNIDIYIIQYLFWNK